VQLLDPIDFMTASDHKKTIPARSVANARQDVARQLRELEQDARQIADLCAKASKTARLRKIPHAGIGSPLSPS
jgi:hypothetical protein